MRKKMAAGRVGVGMGARVVGIGPRDKGAILSEQQTPAPTGIVAGLTHGLFIQFFPAW